MAMKFSLVQKSKVVSGAGSAGAIAEILSEAGYEKPFVVTDRGIKEAGIAAKITSVLDENGIPYVEFDEVTPEPPDTMVDRGAQLCREAECDCVIAIGGGAVIDTAKGITVLRFNSGRIMDYAAGREMKLSSGLIAVPTTSGTGSELSDGMVISNAETGQKVPILGDKAMSEYIILDPELPAGMPPALTAITGLDVFSHAMESYTTIFTTPVIAPICEKIMEDVAEYLPKAVKDGRDIEARERMHIAASLGGWMLANGNSHVGHSLAHVIGARFHIPHGAACSYGAPAMLRFIAPAASDKVKRIGQILGAQFKGTESPEEIGRITAEAYIAFRDSLGIKAISEYDLTEKDMTALAPKIVAEVFAPLTPITVDNEAAEKLLKETARQSAV